MTKVSYVPIGLGKIMWDKLKADTGNSDTELIKKLMYYYVDNNYSPDDIEDMRAQYLKRFLGG